jgi:hypothetical protein
MVDVVHRTVNVKRVNKTVSVAFDDLVEFCERNGYSFAIT